MKNVILLGDSIRMNYQFEVKKLLREEARIYAPGENCRFARYTYFNLVEWLPCYPKPDVIHWNNGLWDCILRYDGKPFTPIGEYIRDMAAIYEYLENTGAKLIFATCTPSKDSRIDWDNKIIEDYNHAMLNFLKGKNIVINDLWTTVGSDLENMVCDDGIHLSKYGIQVCGEKIANLIRSLF